MHRDAAAARLQIDVIGKVPVVTHRRLALSSGAVLTSPNEIEAAARNPQILYFVVKFTVVEVDSPNVILSEERDSAGTSARAWACWRFMLCRRFEASRRIGDVALENGRYWRLLGVAVQRN